MNNVFDMYAFGEKLWPLNRSITGPGLRDTLDEIKNVIPELEVHSVPTGKKVFDWQVPPEWTLQSAYIEDLDGNKIIDADHNNLHVVGYSHSIDQIVTKQELDLHLHSIPELPDAIPYVTSYYQKDWGFCLSHNQRNQLREPSYRVVINSTHADGYLNYGELILRGTDPKTTQEIFLSTYICHPSMANNELSGPVVTIALIKWLKTLQNRRYNYRIVFIPETIGSIAYLSDNLKDMKANIIAGFNITCVGDNRSYSYLPSRDGNTLSDRAAKLILNTLHPDHVVYDWKDRGSDERQYCAPGIDLPIASIMRTKYGEYPEYHTSLDKFGTVVTREGLEGGFNVIKSAISAIEHNYIVQTTCLGEPQLGRRDLYPNTSNMHIPTRSRDYLNVLTWADGTNDTIEIAKKTGLNFEETHKIIQVLISHKLLKKIVK